MALASLSFTGTRTLVSRDVAGGDDFATALDDATAFSVFFRARLHDLPEATTCYLWRVTNGNNYVLSAAVVESAGKVTSVYDHYASDGTANSSTGIPTSSYPEDLQPDHDYVVAFTGRVSGGKWLYTLRINDIPILFGFNPDNPDWPGPTPNYTLFGRRPTLGYRLELGNAVGGASISFDDLTIWKNHALTDAEANGLTIGRIDPAGFRASDQVLRLTGDGTIGAPIGLDEPGRQNVGGHALKAEFATSDTAFLGTGTAVYGPNLRAEPIVGVEGKVMRSGETLLFRLVPPEGQALTGVGTVAHPYPTVTDLPAVQKNGAAMTLARMQYKTIDGPTWLSFLLPAKLSPSDVLTFSWPAFAITAKVDGRMSGTMAYTDEPVTNETDVPYVLPASRTGMQFGENMEAPITLANWLFEGATYWDGAAIVDAHGQLQDVDSGGTASGTTRLELLANATSSRPPASMWLDTATTVPPLPYGVPNLPKGRYCLTWTGTFNFNGNLGSTKSDAILDLGIAGGTGSPYAGKYLSYCTISNVNAIASAGGVPYHRLYFDVAWDRDNTGHAVESSTGGDDFVRPTCAVQTILKFECNGTKVGGLAGPRKDLALYHLGFDPADLWFDPATPASIPEFYPLVVDNCRKAKYHTLRMFIHTIPPSVESVPSLDHVTRFLNPAHWARVDRPGHHTFLATVQSLENYQTTGPADYNEGFRHQGNKGVLLRVNTATNHGFTEGTTLYVSGDGATPPTIPVANNGASGANDITYRAEGMSWRGTRLVIHRILSPTSFLVFHDANRQLTANVLLLNSPTTGVLGTVGNVMTAGKLTPAESVRFTAAAECPRCWINSPGSFTDAEINRYADVIAAAVTPFPTMKVVHEYDNEIWNFIFSGFLHANFGMGAMPGSGATFSATVAGGAVTGVTITNAGDGQYFYGHDYFYDLVVGGPGTGAVLRARVVNGLFTAVDVVAGGTGYTTAPGLSLPPYNALSALADWMCFQTRRMQKLWKARFLAAGLAADRLEFALSCQGFDGSPQLSRWQKAGFPTTGLFLSCTNYSYVNDRIHYAYPGPYFEPEQWRDQTIGQLLDQARIYVTISDRLAGAPGMRAWMDANGFAEMEMRCYEEGWEEVITGPGGNYSYPYDATELADLRKEWVASRSLCNHPDFYEVECERARRHAPYLAAGNHFYWGPDAEGTGSRVAVWTRPFGTGTRVGRGLGPGFVPAAGLVGSAHDNRTNLVDTLEVEAISQAAFGDWNTPGSLGPGEGGAALSALSTLTATGAPVGPGQGAAALSALSTLTATASSAGPSAGGSAALFSRRTSRRVRV